MNVSNFIKNGESISFIGRDRGVCVKYQILCKFFKNEFETNSAGFAKKQTFLYGFEN